MQSIKRKLQRFNQRPYKRWELYLQFAYPWAVAGTLAVAGASIIEQLASSELAPLWLFVIVVAMVIYMVFAMGYTGVQLIKPYMDGIYQQHLKEYEERKAKAESKND